MTERFDVKTAGRLLDALKSQFEGWRVNTLRERVRLGCVRVNGERVSRDGHPLQVGDRVEIDGRGTSRSRSDRSPPRAFTTLYTDDDLIAIDKPAGLLSVSTDRQRTRTALAILRDSLSHPGRTAPLWPVHRLDRETSGVLLFARTRDARDTLQARWSETHKVYLTVVCGHPEPRSGTIDQPLWEDRSLNVRVNQRPGAKQARTHYHTSERGPHHALLKVELDTGRRHQIRAHLAWLGHPVVGDRRYGSAATRMGLHALRLSIIHPRTNLRLVFEAPPPRAFAGLLGSSTS